ncbi:predicted protein [Botrytis cinerea T4]|uniref:Uncharacterized protein n=1 Tax=Botryotinia fuckeliana (strain T4) TaxID=999810 RepID=G2YN54_BOTF4|nr:predicted protein [Botrytis cinerea T4]
MVKSTGICSADDPNWMKGAATRRPCRKTPFHRPTTLSPMHLDKRRRRPLGETRRDLHAMKGEGRDTFTSMHFVRPNHFSLILFPSGLRFQNLPDFIEDLNPKSNTSFG